MSTEPSSPTTLDSEWAPGGSSPGANRRLAVVMYLNDRAVSLELLPGGSLTAGRAPPSDLIVDDRSVSRQHARFTRMADQITVEDLGSRNGTWVGGQRVQQQALKVGGSLVLGSIVTAIQVLSDGLGGGRSLDGFEDIMAGLREALPHARTDGSSLALLMVSAVDQERAHVSHFSAAVRGALRERDHLAIYGPHSLLAVLQDTDRAAAEAVAEAVIGCCQSPTLVCGLAMFPEAATNEDELLAHAHRAARQSNVRNRISRAKGSQGAPVLDASRVVVGDAKMRRLFRMIDKVAQSSAPVLIFGETGTGKEIIAESIHRGSGRGGSLVTVNCGAIPQSLLESTLFGHERGAFTGALRQAKGIFEEADGGTVFLDEVGELAEAAQAALLRVLDTKCFRRVGGSVDIEVDTRIIAATNRDLDSMVEEGSYRLDLLYRLNALTLEVPPLRERRDEIDPFVELFMKDAVSKGYGTASAVDADALEALRCYRWPGNIRQLRNVVERAVVICDGEASSIGLGDLPQTVRSGGVEPPGVGEAVAPSERPGPPEVEQGGSFKDRVRAYERQLIVEALKKSGGNQVEAAKLLEMPRRTFVHKLKAFDLTGRSWQSEA